MSIGSSLSGAFKGLVKSVRYPFKKIERAVKKPFKTEGGYAYPYQSSSSRRLVIPADATQSQRATALPQFQGGRTLQDDIRQRLAALPPADYQQMIAYRPR